MTVTPPTGVTDTSWITFNSNTRTVSYFQNNPGFDGVYTIKITGTI